MCWVVQDNWRGQQEMVDKNIDFAEQVSIEASITGTAGYVDMKFVPPTSNTLERFFSKAKFFLRDYRYRITPDISKPSFS